MERIELITVQLEEAKRMIELNSQPHQRLALLLLDNAAEVIMARMIGRLLWMNESYLRTIETCRRMPQPLIPTYAEMLKEAEANWVSPEREAKLDRFFDDKAKFLVVKQAIEEPVALALRKLHAYRNEAYHKEKLRPGSLAPSVLIYFDLACELFGRWQPMAIGHTGRTPPGLKRHLNSRGAASMPGFDLTKKIAITLRKELKLDVPAVRTALIEHLDDRLDYIEEMLTFIARDSPRPQSVEHTLHMIQAVTKENVFTPEEDLLAISVKFSMADLIRWRRRVARIELLNDRLKMFTAFARIEDEFEPLEGRVLEVAEALDNYIEQEIDFIRGK